MLIWSGKHTNKVSTFNLNYVPLNINFIRLNGISKNISAHYNHAPCKNIWQNTSQIYTCDYKKQIQCLWNSPTNKENKCGYICLVPEFLEHHVLNEIENFWRPNLWKKDQKLQCFWEGCNFVVETQMKGAKPLSRLKNHIKMHLGIKSCVCEKCNQRFANLTRFRDHYGYVIIKSVSSGLIPICLTDNV